MEQNKSGSACFPKLKHGEYTPKPISVPKTYSYSGVMWLLFTEYVNELAAKAIQYYTKDDDGKLSNPTSHP